MRYTHEHSILHDQFKPHDSEERKKSMVQYILQNTAKAFGLFIANKIGFKQEKTQIDDRYKIQLEIIDTDKWELFKIRLLNLGLTDSQKVILHKAFEELDEIMPPSVYRFYPEDKNRPASLADPSCPNCNPLMARRHDHGNNSLSAKQCQGCGKHFAVPSNDINRQL
jgi:hypothetical protein